MISLWDQAEWPVPCSHCLHVTTAQRIPHSLRYHVLQIYTNDVSAYVTCVTSLSHWYVTGTAIVITSAFRRMNCLTEELTRKGFYETGYILMKF